MSDVVSARMKRTWDSLARRNSMHYIARDKDDWEVETFLQVGQQRLYAVLRRVDVEPGDCCGTVVDLGCGIGRLALVFA